MKVQRGVQLKTGIHNKENCSISSNLNNNNANNHPSCESFQKSFKPSIKIGYKVTPNFNMQDLKQPKTGRRQVKNSLNIYEKQSIPENSSRVKIIDPINNQYNSGKFIGSQYCKNAQNSELKNSRNSWYSRGKVTDARNKYQISNSTQNCIKGQFIQKREASCFANSRQTKSRTQISDNCSLSRSKYATKSRQVMHSPNRHHNQSKNSYVSQKRKLPSYCQQGITDIIQYWHAGQYKQAKITQKCNKIQNDLKSRYAKFNQIHQFDFRKKIRQLQKIR